MNDREKAVSNAVVLAHLPAGVTCIDVTSSSGLSITPEITVLSDEVTETKATMSKIKAGKQRAANIAWQLVDAAITGPTFNFTGKVYQDVDGDLVCLTDAPDVQVRPNDIKKLVNER